jgi:hypothetical protein
MKKNMNNQLDGETRNITIGIRFTEKEMEEIEEIAKNLNIPKTRLIRNIALSGLKDAKFLNNFGILKGTQKLLEFEARLKNPKKYPQLEV